ncbi:MAG TPA: social motility TPR repeat lipoprotein Tgl [Myxococcaceae bacterium]|nr:social motility TPR repeat lipoprotein Tgl [Myxococcaceae bacterium]
MFHRTPSLAAALLVLAACRHVPTEKELQGAQIHYDLGVQAQQGNDVQGAFKEFEAALTLDPRMAEAHNAMGILLHLSFQKPDEAIEHFKTALEIRPAFSEVKTNLGNVYLDQSRYDEAIAQYQEALNDMLYSTPFIAQGNLGWAMYRKGNVAQALDHIKAAVTLNPRFCLGYKNLGIIYGAQGNAEESCRQYGKYQEHCPDVADAYYQWGVCLGKQGKVAEAREKFAACQAKAANDQIRDDCRQLQEKLQ